MIAAIGMASETVGIWSWLRGSFGQRSGTAIELVERVSYLMPVMAMPWVK